MADAYTCNFSECLNGTQGRYCTEHRTAEARRYARIEQTARNARNRLPIIPSAGDRVEFMTHRGSIASAKVQAITPFTGYIIMESGRWCYLHQIIKVLP